MTKYKSRREWWTRERVILGLQRFHGDFGFCPTSTEHYAEKQQFTGQIIGGRAATQGHLTKYPSVYAVLKFFRTFREAWAAAGFDTDKHREEWSPIEDWFIIESCGILPRKEVGEILQRTEAAVKRRLYDLGRITANTRWGMSVARAEKLMSVPGQMINRYIKHGIIPVFRGHKNIYLNPADLLRIQEFDWSRKDIDPELERAIRLSLIHRALKILKFRDRWRDHEIYKIEQKKVYHGRIKNPRRSPLLENTPAPPNDLKAGDWTVVTERHKQIAPARQGRICSVHFSWQKVKRKDGIRRACWIAVVEFPKLRTLYGEKSRRIKYSLPLDLLEKAAEPPIEKPPLSQKAEAVRSRRRFKRHTARAGVRFEEIRRQIT